MAFASYDLPARTPPACGGSSGIHPLFIDSLYRPSAEQSMPRRAIALTALSRIGVDEAHNAGVRRAPNVQTTNNQEDFSNSAWNCMDNAWDHSSCPTYVSQSSVISY